MTNSFTLLENEQKLSLTIKRIGWLKLQSAAFTDWDALGCFFLESSQQNEFLSKNTLPFIQKTIQLKARYLQKKILWFKIILFYWLVITFTNGTIILKRKFLLKMRTMLLKYLHKIIFLWNKFLSQLCCVQLTHYLFLPFKNGEN